MQNFKIHKLISLQEQHLRFQHHQHQHRQGACYFLQGLQTLLSSCTLLSITYMILNHTQYYNTVPSLVLSVIKDSYSFLFISFTFLLISVLSVVQYHYTKLPIPELTNDPRIFQISSVEDDGTDSFTRSRSSSGVGSNDTGSISISRSRSCSSNIKTTTSSFSPQHQRNGSSFSLIKVTSPICSISGEELFNRRISRRRTMSNSYGDNRPSSMKLPTPISTPPSQHQEHRFIDINYKRRSFHDQMMLCRSSSNSKKSSPVVDLLNSPITPSTPTTQVLITPPSSIEDEPSKRLKLSLDTSFLTDARITNNSSSFLSSPVLLSTDQASPVFFNSPTPHSSSQQKPKRRSLFLENYEYIKQQEALATPSLNTTPQPQPFTPTVTSFARTSPITNNTAILWDVERGFTTNQSLNCARDAEQPVPNDANRLSFGSLKKLILGSVKSSGSSDNGSGKLELKPLKLVNGL